MASERHREVIQRQIHQDWANREYIEVISNSIKKITAFLNSFGKILFSFKTLQPLNCKIIVLSF